MPTCIKFIKILKQKLLEKLEQKNMMTSGRNFYLCYFKIGITLAHMCLAPFNLALEKRLKSQPEKNAIIPFLVLFVCNTCNTVSLLPYPFVWCLRPSGRNLGTFQSQVTISEVPKCRVILTICSWVQGTCKRV